MKGERIWNAAAWTLSGLAVAASLNTVLSAPRQREIVAGKEASLRTIQAYAGRWAREEALKERLDARQAWKPVDLDEWAIRTLGMNTAKITPRPATAAADGWQRREVSVEMREVAYGEAALFLAGAATNAAGVAAARDRDQALRRGRQGGHGRGAGIAGKEAAVRLCSVR